MQRFTCPLCSTVVLVPEGSEGMSITCPVHGGPVPVTDTVPALAEDWPALARVRVFWDCLRRRASDRKARLFACACLHRLEHLLPMEYRQALQSYERFANGLVGWDELADITAATLPAQAELANPPGRVEGACFWLAQVLATDGGARCGEGTAWTGANRYVDHAINAGLWVARQVADWAHDAEHRSQCALLWDVFGGLFAPIAVEPEWLAWNGGAVVQLAQGIYDERRFQDLPVLADALEEAGCTEAAILEHCRQPGEHVRGCWVVDLLLRNS
jgi:hypothetical protein